MRDTEPTEQDPDWPPRPTSVDETGERVWRSPYDAGPESETPFQTLHLCASGSVSDFRSGWISVYREGIEISGKAVLDAQTQFCILFLIFVATARYIEVFGWFAAAVVLDCIRFRHILRLSWDEIEEVRLSGKYPLVCFVYREQGPGSKTRRYSLAPRMGRAGFEAFSAAFSRCAPPSVKVTPNGRMTFLCGSAALYSFLAGAPTVTAVMIWEHWGHALMRLRP